MASDWVGLRHLQAKEPEAASAKAKAHSDVTRRPGSEGGTSWSQPEQQEGTAYRLNWNPNASEAQLPRPAGDRPESQRRMGALCH